MRLLPALLALLLAACMVTDKQDRFLAKFADPRPTLDTVLVCHGYGCRNQDRVDLRRDWPRLIVAFDGRSSDAEEERARIAQTIAAFETVVGAMTGTDANVGGTFAGFGLEGQLDCIDETVNTTTYLTLLEQAGLLAWHDVRAPMSRGFFVNGWPHTTAVIVERGSERAYAVDSWFHDNGAPPEIVPLDLWLSGWTPDDVVVERIVEVVAAPAVEVTVAPLRPR